jgi:hypothetical protein
MLHWCCVQVRYPPRRIAAARFGHTSRWPGRGTAWPFQRRFTIIVCYPEMREIHFPHYERSRVGPITLHDATDFMVATTAHELQHLQQYRAGKIRLPAILGRLTRIEAVEYDAEQVSHRVLDTFRHNQTQLLARWNRLTQPKG